MELYKKRLVNLLQNPNLKATAPLKNCPMKIPKSWWFLFHAYNSSNCFINNFGELEENRIQSNSQNLGISKSAKLEFPLFFE